MANEDTDRLDDEMSEEELAEAESLMKALERGSGTDLPEDALEAAALLRYSAGDGELGGTRMDAILEDVFESAKERPKEETSSPWLAWLKWLVPVGALAAAGVFALVVLNQGGAPVATRLPPPDVELLTAQARVASQDEGSDGALASAMGDYRQVMLSSLSRRYGK
jgi:hypothetical protein